jgi:hypothetical protein
LRTEERKDNGRTSLTSFTKRIWQFEEPMNLQIQFVHNSPNEFPKRLLFPFIQVVHIKTTQRSYPAKNYNRNSI